MMKNIDIKLNREVTYVAGKVNGNDVDFKPIDDITWRGITQRDESNTYKVEIKAYANSGAVAEFETTMYQYGSWIEPKLDWKETDYYNYWDLDRVENNTKVVADMLGVTVEDIVIDRDYKSIPYARVLNKVEGNIEKVSYLPLEGLEEMKTNWQYGDSFDWKDALRLEKNLKITYDVLFKNRQNQLYCGTFLCGEEVV